MFDFSFIQIVRISGIDVYSIIEEFTSRDISKMKIGSIHYSFRVSRVGQVLSDLTIWKIDETMVDVMTGDSRDAEYLIKLDNHGALKLERLNYYNFCDIKIGGVWTRVGRLG